MTLAGIFLKKINFFPDAGEEWRSLLGRNSRSKNEVLSLKLFWFKGQEKIDFF